MFLLAVSGAISTSPAAALPPEWVAGPGYRSAMMKASPAGKTGFIRLDPATTGISFTNRLAVERYTTNQIYLNGSGVAAGDFDGDGWCDLYFCGLDGPNRLYRNLGNWKFEDVTGKAGVACENLDASGAAFADLDGDGNLDLVVNSVKTGTELWHNAGQGRFTKLGVVNLNKAGMSLALADVDGDGDLDLYVTNYRTQTIRDQPQTKLRLNHENGRLVVLKVDDRPATEPDLVGRFTVDLNGKLLEHGEADVLYRNDGGGRLAPVSFTGGAFLDEEGKPLGTPPYDWGLSVMFRDINGDSAPDIYVCNDFSSEDRIWINNGQGQFRAMARLALRHTSLFSMGVDFADLNRDGYDEFLVADMLSRDHQKRHLQSGDLLPIFLPIGQIENRPQYARNTLFFNRGDNTYADIAEFSHLEASEWSWTPIFLDVDLDGFEDLLVTTGHERDARNADVIEQIGALKAQKKMSKSELLQLNNMFSRLDLSHLAFRNRGDLTFEEVSAAWGFNTVGVSHGMALGDLDNDGDLDVAVNHLNAVATVYRNDGSAPRIAVRLKGLPPNTRGIGAKIKILGGPAPQGQEMICGGRYLSSDDTVRVFAAGASSNHLRIEVNWRSGKRSVVEKAKANHLFEVEENGAAESAITLSPASKLEPLFEDVSDLLKHRHQEEAFDDFARQPLLPRRLSQLGPGVTWADVNEDGWDDLLVTSGRGGHLGFYRNTGKGTFTQVVDPSVTRAAGRDLTTILASEGTLIAGSANYEDGLTNGGLVRMYDLKRQVTGESILGHQFSAGPLALADLDADGDLDLFVGGRVVPGRYPEPTDCLLMRNDGGKFVIWQRLEKVGLVSGGLFSDLDGDGKPELLVACEWGPLRVFRQQGDKLDEITRGLGLAEYTGWWNGIATGDFDGDGRLDIIASNWGLNTHYRASRGNPQRIYYGDLDGNGTVDVIEAYAENGREVPGRGLKTVAAVLPFLRNTTPTYAAYGRATLQEIYGGKLKTAHVSEANTLASMVFFNRGDHFEGKPLPREAQWATAFGISVGDLNGDGQEDIFLSQNFFGTNPETARSDAGRGLCLRGHGDGTFTPLTGSESGVMVYGEQRGCALADYDGDGRLDLVVSQNGNATRLYHNIRAQPGLRVRLKGQSGNRAGVGAAIRIRYGQRLGPVREVRAGSGYWSQDSSTQVFSKAQTPTGIWVRWPGGRIHSASLPSGVSEIEFDFEGKVAVLLQ